MSSGFPLDGTQKYWIMDAPNGEEYPARVLSAGAVPEVCIKGQWQPYYRISHFLQNCRAVSEGEFNRAVAEQTARR